MKSGAETLKPAERIIVALDYPSAAPALALADRLGGEVGCFKVGLQLYTAEGPDLVRELRRRGARVFLDLKLHDIPNTVAQAVRSAAALDVQMLTLHLGGGRAMIEAAVAARPEGLLLLGVTVLTSSTEETLRETGVPDPLAQQVERLGRLGVAAGIGGLVASPHEVGLLRREMPAGIRLVIPGIRPAGSDPGDQKRHLTPREAVAAGADYLVIGRPITAAADPAEALGAIVRDLA